MPISPYLHDIPLDQAVQRLNEGLAARGLLRVLESDEIPVSADASGRVLAEPVFALGCSPHYHASAMDGFAVRSADTTGAQPSKPVMIEVDHGAVYVDTGDALPDWADAVIPIENVESLDRSGEVIDVEKMRSPYAIRIRAGVSPWSHVRPVGEDLIIGQLILAAGERLRPPDLGAIAAGGVTRLRVAKKPVIGILPTGDELVPLEKDPQKGEIPEFNSIVIAAQVREWGAVSRCYPITRDVLKSLTARIAKATRECDLVLVNAGSSAGKEDFTARAVEALGEVIVHGIAVRPGHPVIIGFVDVTKKGHAQRIPVIGVPGYPVSAAMTTEILVRPLIDLWLGSSTNSGEVVQAVLTRKTTSPAGDDDYVRVVLGEVNGKMLAAPIARGAGVTTSLSKADGTLVIPRMVQGIEAGEHVNIQILRSRDQISRNLLTIGSHDLTLDLLAKNLMRFGRRLVSSNAGSMGGLLALKRDECHFAGCHLLDPLTGTYNTTEIQILLPGRKPVILRWVRREQGLMVKKGNPKGIATLKDLVCREVTFVNRQRGAGTRVLLDYYLNKLGLKTEMIRGYDQEEYTHLGVAVAVASGRADCGMGVAASAYAMGLEFIPMFNEEYELIFPEGAEKDAFVKPVFLLANDREFKSEVMKMPGYDVTFMGEIRSNC